MPTVKELITSLLIIADRCPEDTKIYFASKQYGDLLSPNMQTLVKHRSAGDCVVMTNATPAEFKKLTGVEPEEVIDMRKGRQH